MAISKAKNITSWVLLGLVAALFTLGGLSKLTGGQSQMFVDWGYVPWFATVIGVLEVLGAIGLLIPRLTKAAIIGLTGIMIGAAYTHITNDEGAQVIRPLIFLLPLWGAWWLRREEKESS